MTFMLLKKRVSQIFEIYMYKGHVPEFYFVYYELHCFEQPLVLRKEHSPHIRHTFGHTFVATHSQQKLLNQKLK